MHLVRRLLAVVSLTALACVGSSMSAFAAQTVNFGRFSCTIKALPPTLSRGAITGSAQIDCNVSTTLIVEFGVVELDGNIEDRVEVPFQRKAIAVFAGRSIVVPTTTDTCVSTEPGNEELATRARVSLSGTLTTWDRTSPPNDSYAC